MSSCSVQKGECKSKMHNQNAYPESPKETRLT